MLTKQVEEERRAKLSEAERNLEDAIAENEAAIQRAALLDSAGFKKATDQLERLEFATLFDPKIGGNGMRPEVAHQKAMFERTLDVAAATINIAMIRQSLQEKLEPDRLKLQKSEEARAKLLKAPLFDHVSTEMVGDREYVNLTKGDRTVAVSRERFDGRESDEALAAQVFEVPANV